MLYGVSNGGTVSPSYEYSKQVAESIVDRYYVYLHKKKTNGEIFYVGKGSGFRAWTKAGRNSYWNSTVNKHGFDVEILFDCLSEEESHAIEIDVIKELKYFGYKLVNLSSGGEGYSGYRWTDEDKSKLSDNNIYVFINKNGTILNCTRKELSSNFNLGKSVDRLFSKEGRQLHCIHGWGRQLEGETLEQSLYRINNARVDKRRDLLEYTFVNRDTKETIVATRKGIAEFLNTTTERIGALFMTNRPFKTVFSWGVVLPGEDVESAYLRIQSNKGSNKVINDIFEFIHEGGDYFKGTRKDFAEYSGVSRIYVNKLFRKEPRNKVHGWSLIKETYGTS